MQYYLLYDGMCGFCKFFKRIVLFLDHRKRLMSVELSNPVSILLLEGIDPFLAVNSFHLVSAKGKILSGSKAVPQLIYLLTNSSKVRILLATSPMRNMIHSTYSVLTKLKGVSKCGVRPPSSRLSQIRKIPVSLFFRIKKEAYLLNEVKT